MKPLTRSLTMLGAVPALLFIFATLCFATPPTFAQEPSTPADNAIFTGQITADLAHIDVDLVMSTTVASIVTSRAFSNTIVLTFRNVPTPTLTTDGGLTWRALPAGSSEPMIAIAPSITTSIPQIYYADSQSLYRTSDYGQNWEIVETPEHDGCQMLELWPDSILQLVAAPLDSTRLYLRRLCTGEAFGHAYDIARLLLSENAGVTWEERDAGDISDPGPAFYSLVPSPVVTDAAYYLGPDRFALTLDAVDAGLSYAIGMDEAGEPTAGTRSKNDEETEWAQQPCGLGTTEFNSTHLQLMAHPTQTQMLFLRCERGLYRSENGGDNWTQLAPIPGQLLAPDYGTPGRIFWARETGLWASVDNGESWQRLMSYQQAFGLPLFLPSVVKPQPRTIWIPGGMETR